MQLQITDLVGPELGGDRSDYNYTSDPVDKKSSAASYLMRYYSATIEKMVAHSTL